MADYDPASYWSTQHYTLSAIAAANIAATKTPAIPQNINNNNNKPLYNPYEGDPSARQLAESTKDFLSRLPPLTTPASKIGPWIWIANPHSAVRPLSQDLGAFTAAGRRILESLSAEILAQENALVGRPQLLLNRKLTQLRKTATEQILSAATENEVTTGKWMLFPPPEEVNAVWQHVADATVSGQLGSSAKVATDSGIDHQGMSRLVCVYTEDFSNEGDVKRVLKKLVEIGLVNKKEAAGASRGLYYKCGRSSLSFLGGWGRGAFLGTSEFSFTPSPSPSSPSLFHQSINPSRPRSFSQQDAQSHSHAQTHTHETNRRIHPPRHRFQERMGPQGKFTRF